MYKYLLIFICFSSIIHQGKAQDSPIELGDVEWLRDMSTAIEQSNRLDKPILILFQEVPGCSTCKNYGKDVLSHPLIVEAIESLFIPLCIHNNKKGKDADLLKYFDEPTWNNPVVRIVDKNKRDIVERVNSNYSSLALVQSMNGALQIQGHNIPYYLEMLEHSLRAESEGLETIYLSMYCFWSGELNLGELDGVYKTKAGFMNGEEVVEVRYLPSEININHLLEIAKKAKCADGLYCESQDIKLKAEKQFNVKLIRTPMSFKLDKTPKYYLSQTAYKFVPMTDFQACRANSLIGKKKPVNHLLSPNQLDTYYKAMENGGKGMNIMVEKGL